MGPWCCSVKAVPGYNITKPPRVHLAKSRENEIVPIRGRRRVQPGRHGFEKGLSGVIDRWRNASVTWKNRTARRHRPGSRSVPRSRRIQRRVYQAGGPACCSAGPRERHSRSGNLFGTLERAKFVFRDTLESVRRLVELKVDPGALARNPWRYRGTPRTLLRLLPRRVRSAPILAHQIAIDQLPQIQCWPMDGGPFITLPQVYTEDPDRPAWAVEPGDVPRPARGQRVRAEPRGRAALPDPPRDRRASRGGDPRGEPLRVNVFVGGPPALTVAAVMPLPEGLPELAFAGAWVAGASPWSRPTVASPCRPRPTSSSAARSIPTSASRKGPSATTSATTASSTTFPVLRVERVYHRDGAIWPFTSVGRPPQEDTTFGALDPRADRARSSPAYFPGVHAVHAVDAAGVHPLLLAIASERYVPDAPCDARRKF